MVEIADVKDQESLKEWLETFSDDKEVRRKAAVDIAVRAALRVLPAAWEWFLNSEAGKRQMTAMPLLRASIVMQVAAQNPTQKNREKSAFPSISSSGFSGRNLSSAAAAIGTAQYTSSIRTYDLELNATTAKKFALATVKNTKNILNEDNLVWREALSDCGKIKQSCNLGLVSLWVGENPLEEVWEKIRSVHSPRPVGSGEYGDGRFGAMPNGPWAFWIDWYEKVLSGTPQDWDLLQAIVDEVDWDRSVEEVNAEIAGIVLKHQIEEQISQKPLPWTIQLSRDKKLISKPTEEKDLSKIIEDIRTALREHTQRCKKASDGNNIGGTIKSAFDRPIAELRTKITKYKDNPADLHRVLEETQQEIQQIARIEGLANESIVLRLFGNLNQRSQDICIASPDVFEMVKKRKEVEFTLLAREQIERARSIASGMEKGAKGEFQVALAFANAVLVDPNRSDQEKANAWYFLSAAFPRAADVVVNASEEQTGKGKRKRSFGELLGTTAKRAGEMDKIVDVGQEAIAESAGWLPDFVNLMQSGGIT